MKAQKSCFKQYSRRRVTAGLAGFAVFAAASPSFALLTQTPRQMAGPFYPNQLPLDADNDLVNVAGQPSPARGKVAHIFGSVRDVSGTALSGLRVEIWQCDASGRYHHPRDRGGIADPNFQGFGATSTDNQGRFRFRTIKPVAYPGRAPHIHFAVLGPSFAPITTQMYVAGEPLNQRDFLLNSIRDREARESLIVDFKPAPEIETGSVGGTFNIILANS